MNQQLLVEDSTLPLTGHETLPHEGTELGELLKGLMGLYMLQTYALYKAEKKSSMLSELPCGASQPILVEVSGIVLIHMRTITGREGLTSSCTMSP